MSTTERFITPASSSKMRNATILRASHSRSASVSSAATAASTRSPGPIAPTTRPSTLTAASRTRWISARMAAAPAAAYVPRLRRAAALPPGAAGRRRSLLHDLALDVDDDALRERQRRHRFRVAGGRQVRPPRRTRVPARRPCVSGCPSLASTSPSDMPRRTCMRSAALPAGGPAGAGFAFLSDLAFLAGASLMPLARRAGALCRQYRDFRRVELEVAQFLRRPAGHLLVHGNAAFARALVHVGVGDGRNDDRKRRSPSRGAMGKGLAHDRFPQSGVGNGPPGVTIPLFAATRARPFDGYPQCHRGARRRDRAVPRHGSADGGASARGGRQNRGPHGNRRARLSDAGARSRRRAGRPGRRGHLLHVGAGPAGAAGGDRAALRRALRRDHRPRTGDRDRRVRPPGCSW